MANNTLDDVTAYRLANSLDIVPPEEKQKALSLLADYEKTQARARLEEMRGVENMFTDRKTYGMPPEKLNAFRGALAGTMKPKDEEFRALNKHFLSTFKGVDQERASKDYESFRKAYAKEYMDKDDTTDEGFYNHIGDTFTVEKELTNKAFSDGIIGLPTIFGFTSAASELSKKPGWNPKQNVEYLQRYQSVFNTAAKKRSMYEDLIREGAQAIQKKGDEDTPNPEITNIADRMLKWVPQEDIGFVVSAMGATAGSTPDEAKSYMAKIGAGIARMAEQQWNASEGLMVDSALRIGEGLLTEDRNFKGAQDIEEKRKEQRRLFILSNRINKALEEGVPLEAQGWWAESGISAARSLPMMASSFVPFAGWTSMAAYFRDDTASTLMQQNPDMSFEQADGIATVGAPFMASVELISNKIPFGKIPFVGAYLKNGMTSIKSMLTRGVAARVVGGTVAETLIEEPLQNRIPLWTQAGAGWLEGLSGEMSKDMPGVDWVERNKELAKLPGQVFGPALLLSIVGGGGSSIVDMQNGRSLASNLDLLIATGASPELAAEIKGAADAGNWSSVDALLARTVKPTGDSAATEQQRIEAATRLQRQDEAAAQQERQELQAAGVSIQPSTNGWKVTDLADGSAVEMPSHEEAMGLVKSKLETQEISQDEDLFRAFTDYSKRAKEGEKFTISSRSGTLADREAEAAKAGNVEALDAIWNRLAMEQENRQDPTLTLKDLNVLGDNVVEFKGAVKTYASTIYQRGGAIDLVEEKSEGDLKRWVNTGRTTYDDFAKMIRGAELVTGDTYLQKDSPLGVIEGYSSLARLWATGSREGEVGGAVRSSAAKQARAMRDRLKAAEADPEVRPLIQKLKDTMTFFKAVMGRVRALQKAKKKGLGEIEAFLNESTGLTEEIEHVAAVESEVSDMIGPTFSLAEGRGAVKVQDAEYLAAVEAGDTSKAQKMVDDYAFESGYDINNGDGYWRSVRRDGLGGELQTRPESYITDDKEAARTYKHDSKYALQRVYAKIGNVAEVDSLQDLRKLTGLKINNTDFIFEEIDRSDVRSALWSKGYDSVNFEDVGFDSPGDGTHEAWLLQEAGSIKSANAITRDSSGQIIPLSQRFNPASNSISFSLETSDRLEAMALALGTRVKDKPKERLNIIQRAVERINDAAKDWAKIPAARDLKDIEREAKIREAFEYSEYLKDTFQAVTEQQQKEVPVFGRKSARAEAKAAVDAWRQKEIAKTASATSNKARMLAAMRALDAAITVLPVSERAKVGGFIQLAELSTDEARIAEIERRFEKIPKILESYFKKELNADVEKLFKKYKPERDPGDKAKGKLGADAQQLVDAAQAAMGLDAIQTQGRIADIDARIATGELTPEQEILAERERSMVELFGDWKNADAARMSSALDALEETSLEGWAKWKLKQLMKKEERTEQRKALKADTGKTGSDAEISLRRDFGDTFRGAALDQLISGSSYSQLLDYAFGRNSKTAKQMIDNERKASNQFEDAIQAQADIIDAYFTGLAGSATRGEQLRYDMALRTIEVQGAKLSQLQAIQALLMWNQEDGRRHMEGPRDENNNPIPGMWSYDQAWIDSVKAQMTPQAFSVMSFIQSIYAAEWAPLNALYRERHGIDLPHHNNYAPITTQPQQVKAGQVVDPVSGGTITGSVLTPGALRGRNHSAVAQPRFEDALQTLIGHTKQIEHWKAYYDFAVDAQAVFGNRDLINAVEAKAGKATVKALQNFLDYFAQGGIRDAGASLAMNQAMNQRVGRASQMMILGRVSTLLVQSTQLGAASVEMPTMAYLKRFGQLISGQLSWSKAVKSDFIQRRYKTAPPIVQQAMKNLATANRPNIITHGVRLLGNTLSGADALFTGGTYAILLDYHMETGAQLGLSGSELEAYAHAEAERATERVAQPMRGANRSLMELTTTNPLAKSVWAFASEARQKAALQAWAAVEAKSNPSNFSKTFVLTFIIGGLMPQILRNLWRDTKGDDDEEKWSAKRLTTAALLGPLKGIPGGSMESIMAFSPKKLESAYNSLKEGPDSSPEELAKATETVLMFLGMFHDTPAAMASFSHIARDAVEVGTNITSEDE